MTGRIRKAVFGLFLLALVALILVYVIISHTSIPAKGITHFVNRAVPEGSHLGIAVGAVRGGLFNDLRFIDVSLYAQLDEERVEVFHIAEARLRYHLTDLLTGRFLFSEVTLIEPVGLLDSHLLEDLGRKQASEAGDQARPRRLFGVDHMLVQHGKFTYRRSGGKTMTLNSIHLKGRFRMGHGGLRIELASASLHWQERDLLLQALQFQALLSGDSLQVEEFSLQTPASLLQGQGSIARLSSPSLDWSFQESTVSLEELSRAVGWSEGDLEGSVTFDAQLSGPPAGLLVRAEAAGLVNGYPVDTLHVDLERRGSELEFRRFDLRFAGARLAGSGRLLLADLPTYRADVAVTGLDLHSLQMVDLETELNGKVSLAGQGFGVDQVHIEAEVQVGESRLAEYPIEACRGRLILSGTGLSTAGPVVLTSRGTTWKLEGGMLFSGPLEIRNHLDIGDLSRLAAVFALPSFQGRGQADITVSGMISDPDIEGSLQFDHLALSSLCLVSCQASVEVNQVIHHRRGTAQIEATEGHIAAVPFAGLRAHLTLDGTTIGIDSLSAGNDQAAVQAGGVLCLDDGAQQLILTTLAGRFRDYPVAAADTVVIERQADGSLAARGSFETEEGNFDLSGYLDPGGGLRADLSLRSIDLSPLAGTMGMTSRVEGLASGTIGMGGTLEAPCGDLRLSIARGMVATIPFDTLSFSLSYAQRRMDIAEFRLIHGQRAVLICQGSYPLSISLTDDPVVEVLPADSVSLSLTMADFGLLPVSQLVASPRPFDGQCTIGLNLFGTLADPRFTIDCTVDQARYGGLHFGQIQGQLQYRNGRLSIVYLESSYRGTEYASTGYIPLHIGWPLTGLQAEVEPIDVTFGMAGDIPEGLIPMFTDRVQKLSGDTDVRFSLTGALANPILNGDLTMKEGTLQLTDLENPLTDVRMEMEVNDTLLTIHSLGGGMGKEAVEGDNLLESVLRLITFRKKEPPGRLSLSGTINFADVDRLVYDLDVKGQKVFLRPTRQGIDMVADAGLAITGTAYPEISGKVTITQGLVKEAFKPRDAVQPEPRREESPGGMGAGLDLDIRIPGNFWVEGSDYLQELNVELRGDMQILKKKTGPELQFFGTAETIRGKYLIYGNVFRMTQGTISFGGIAEFNPNLDIEAETRVGNELVYLSLGGTLLQPEVRLSSQSGYSEKDIIALLTLGTTTSAADTAGVSGAFESKATTVLGSLIEGELARKARRELGIDTFEISGSAGSRLAPDETQVTVGKYLSDRVYLEYSRRLAAESEQEVELEYRLNRHLSFLGTRDRRGLYHLQLQLKLDY